MLTNLLKKPISLSTTAPLLLLPHPERSPPAPREARKGAALALLSPRVPVAAAHAPTQTWGVSPPAAAAADGGTCMKERGRRYSFIRMPLPREGLHVW